MRTSRPFSTISYNTPLFLSSVLDKLILQRKISLYFFVYHYAEKDERKDHIHLYVEPNGQIDTDSFLDLFLELDLDHPDKPPLSCMPVRSSKFGDAYLYFIHDPAYLATKGQSREYKYSFDDVVCSNYDYLLELVHTIDYTRYFKSADFAEKARLGVSFRDLVLSGYVPVPQIQAYAFAYDLVRNGRQTHSPLNEDKKET